MFIDEATIEVKAGDGGNGSVAFRREKYVPHGGPSGGDGGRGGNVILRADANIKTLIDCSRRPHYKAQRGQHGMGDKKTGSNGDDVILLLPVGTQVSDAETGDLLADLSEHGQTMVAAVGGEGGRGNRRFVTSSRQAPRFAEGADEGQERKLKLALKILADVALIGFPNAGKSTFIAAASAARPKIADYPFTTLVPNLGVVKLDNTTQIVLADIPGLIRGAHKGAGLGHRFLKHIERAPVFIHLLDAVNFSELSLWRQFMTLNRELKKWNEELVRRPQLIAINKVDAISDDPDIIARIEKLEEKLKARGCEVFRISAATGEGIEPLLWRAAHLLQAERELAAANPVPAPTLTYVRPQKPLSAVEICNYEDGMSEWEVEGGALSNLVRRFDISNRDAALFVHQQMERQGIIEELKRFGIKAGDLLHMGDAAFVFEE
jgi:GTP-binding protein